MTNSTDDQKEFVLVYPLFLSKFNMYVCMTTTTPGVVLVEVPYLSMKKNITLNVGRNYLAFNSSLKTICGGYVDNKGIYLKSTVPLSVSVMLDFIENAENVSTRAEYSAGYMALPVSRLGKEYVAITYGNLQFTIAAIHDNTTVRIRIRLFYRSNHIAIAGKTYRNGDIFTTTMNRLDTICITSAGLPMSGTTVFADKDVVFLSGNYYAYSLDAASSQNLSPVNQWGNSFFVPSFSEIPGYYVTLQMAELGGNTTVHITDTNGPQRYFLKQGSYQLIFVRSPPAYIESRKPIQVTVSAYANSSLSTTMIWIPSISQYRGSYLVTNPNTVTPGQFDENLYVILPENKQNGLLVDGLSVHSNERNPTLRVNSSSYAFMTIPMNESYHVITHSDPSVKFGAFVFGKGRLHHKHGQSLYAFPAGIQ